MKFNHQRKAAIASLAVMAAAFVPVAAHANGTQPGTYPVDAYTYATATSWTPTGATNVNVSGGSALDAAVVAVDYGQVANIFLTRYTPALVVVGLAGAVIVASGAALRMVKGGLRGSFH